MTGEGTGRVLAGRYELVSLLGRGSMGEVHCAHDRVLGRDVAVKVFRAGPEAEGGPARRQAEMRVLAGLSHPHVIAAYDAGQDDGTAYLVMQLIHGRTLQTSLPLPSDDVLVVARALASALAHVHAQGVVHRDIKPANVLLGDDGGVWLSDFGTAKLLDVAALTATGLTIGTAGYLSPEQVRGEPVGPPSDVYALGLVLLEALTGARAFPGDNFEAALARLHRSPELPEDLPAPWPDLLPAMTADDPAERPTAEQVLRLLDGSAAAVQVPTPAPTQAAAPGVLRAVLSEAARSRTMQGLVGSLAAVVLGAALLVSATEDGDGRPVAEQQDATAPATAPISAVRLFHPGGSGSDDPQDAPLAADGDPRTTWESQRYSTPVFGNLRPGVGLLYDLGRPVDVAELRLHLPHPGASLRVHAGDEATDALLDTPARATAKDAPGQTNLPVRGAKARYWVVWFERLPEQGQRRAGVAETRFLAR